MALLLGAAAAAESPCCLGACTVAGEEKYWSIAKSLFGTKHCGECCMDPKKYSLYHFFEKNLTKSATDSPCGGFGYTKYDSTTTHGFGPVKMTLDLYDLPEGEGEAEGTCSLYAIDGATCGQSDLDCKYAPYAKKFEKSLKDGTCAAQGYTVKGSTSTKHVPVIGDITITKYTKPGFSEAAEAEPCCLGACTVAGEEKYWSIAKSLFGTKHCGECCMDPKKYSLYHFFEKNLTKSATDSPCGGFGYTKYDSTTTHGFGPVKMTLDLYDLPEGEGEAEGTCSLYAIDGATCGQSDLDCKYAPYAKKFEKSLKDGTCAAQGYTVKGSTSTKHVPVIGDITITEYTKYISVLFA